MQQTGQRLSAETSQSEAERKRILQMIDDNLAESRVSAIYNDDSMDEGQSLINNLENNEEVKKDDDED